MGLTKTGFHEIHGIQQLCEICLSKYRIPVHCLKVKIHEMHIRTSNDNKWNQPTSYNFVTCALLSSNEVDLLCYCTQVNLWYLLSTKYGFYTLLSTCNEVFFPANIYSLLLYLARKHVLTKVKNVSVINSFLGVKFGAGESLSPHRCNVSPLRG